MELTDFLLQVKRPAQYIGREWNASKKEFDKANVRFALSFPDLYEVGMSNLGLRIIYGILNAIPDVACERFFSPGIEMEGLLRSNNQSILSLESQKKLDEFDLAGFSLGSELCYTNVLNILELGGIPLKSSERGSNYPFVIAGGPCTLNPEPMHEFFDIFMIGEAEEAVVELVDIYRKHKSDFKSGKISKSELLLLFSRLEGIYIPSFYETKESVDGLLEEFKPKIEGAPLKVVKRIVKNLDASFFPVEWLVPYIQIIHDRITLEIMRGCPNRCRFCQARSLYYPLRIRKAGKVMELAKQAYKNTGYEEISLGGLSVSDYSEIEEVSRCLLDEFKNEAVSVSLPSIRARSYVGNLSSIIAKVKKTGLTFAPEAGTDKLRNLLLKDFNEEDFFRALEEAYGAGYQRVKLYFMIGLPFETDADLDAIVDFSLKVSELRRKVVKGPAEVNISINTLIPKPHTAFQWFGMLTLQEIERKHDYLRNKIKNRRLKLNFHNSQISILEGILSRGDRRLSAVILSAFKKGAKFDAWSDHFDFQKWMDAFQDSGVEPYSYLNERQRDALLPWDLLDVGVDKDSLEREFNKLIEYQDDKEYNL